MHLQITRQKKHPFTTAYSGVNLRPGAQVITDPAAIATLLLDKRFQADKASGLFTCEEVGVPAAEELEALKGPDLTQVLTTENLTLPEFLNADSVSEAEVIAGEPAPTAIEFANSCAEPHVLFALYQKDTRKTVRAAIAAQLAKVYKRDLTEAEMLGAGVKA